MPLLTESVAEALWEEAQPLLSKRPAPPRPMLVLMSGVPLSGKSTLARALAARASARSLLVENDAVRARVAQRLAIPRPSYEGRENFFTYRASWLLARIALRSGSNVLHDATNLDEGQRKGGYAVADEAGAPVAVVMVLAPREVRDARAARAGPGRLEAHRKLGLRDPRPGCVTRPLVVVDGTAPVEESAARVLDAPFLGPLRGGA